MSNTTHILRKISSFLVGIAAMAVIPVFASDFQIKGLALGMSSSESCKDSPVTDTLGDIVRQFMPSQPSLLNFQTSQCKVDLGTFGGQKLNGSAHLAFLKDELTVVKFELEAVSNTSAANMLRILIEDYGKSRRVIDRPFVTDSWTKAGQTFAFEISPDGAESSDITIVLRHEGRYKVYDMHVQKVKRLLKINADQSNRSDMR